MEKISKALAILDKMIFKRSEKIKKRAGLEDVTNRFALEVIRENIVYSLEDYSPKFCREVKELQALIDIASYIRKEIHNKIMLQ